MENCDSAQFIYDLLIDLNKYIASKSPSNDEYDLSISEIQTIVNEQLKIKNVEFSKHGLRLIHFILYLNTELETCNYIKTLESLNLRRYVCGKPLSKNQYYNVTKILELRPFMIEMILCTPYSFCRDLIDLMLSKAKSMDGHSQLATTEEIFVALMKNTKRSFITSNLESALTGHFNQCMLIFSETDLPYDIRTHDFDDDKKKVTRFRGFIVKSVFKVTLEVIHLKRCIDHYRSYPLYKLKALRDIDQTTNLSNDLFNKFFDALIHKCYISCDFSIDDWISWYEVEVINEDSNLQNIIGYLAFEVQRYLGTGIFAESLEKQFGSVLGNLAIEKVQFNDVDISNIDIMFEHMGEAPKSHISSWIKKMIIIHDIFANQQAIQSLLDYTNSIDIGCMKGLIERCIVYYHNGGQVYDSMGDLLYKGIVNLTDKERLNLLKYILVEHSDNKMYLTKEFDKEFKFLIRNEYDITYDHTEMMSKIILLIMQQPKIIFHLLIKRYIDGIYGYPPKAIDTRRSFIQLALAKMHRNMDSEYVYNEYKAWLDCKKVLSENNRRNLRNWILEITRTLRFIRPKMFLTNVLTPLLYPLPDYDHMVFLIDITKFFLTECQLMTLPELDVCDKLLIQLAKILDDARWTIENFSQSKVELCEKVLTTIEPLVNYAIFTVKPKDLEPIREYIASLSIMTRSHFLNLWTNEYITIEGIEEQFIMTVHSTNHISYINLNRSSTQKTQEEFIFCIATFMPKFTVHEVKSFISNYMSSAMVSKAIDAAYFFLDCFMSALMRIMVYTKIIVQNYDFLIALDYVENTIINFLDAVNTSKMCCIYDEEIVTEVAFCSVTKIIMVIKQLSGDRHLPLLVVIRRIIEVITPKLDEESVSKLLFLIATIKKSSLNQTIAPSVDALLKRKHALAQESFERSIANK